MLIANLSCNSPIQFIRKTRKGIMLSSRCDHSRGFNPSTSVRRKKGDIEDSKKNLSYCNKCEEWFAGTQCDCVEVDNQERVGYRAELK